MALINKLRRSALPSVPPAVEAHATYTTHTTKLAELKTALASTHGVMAKLEQERADVAAAITNDQVAEVLGDDPAATARIATAKRRLLELDAQLVEAKDRASVQAEACTRMEARTDAIRNDIRREIRRDAHQAYVALSESLAEHFAAIAPVNARLLELRQQHGEAIEGAIWWDELYPVGEHGPARPTKMTCWIKHARTLGITPSL